MMTSAAIDSSTILKWATPEQEQQCLNAAKLMVPSLMGTIGSPLKGMIQADGNPQQSIFEIYQYWQQRYPHATHAYWWVRTWSLLYWQPIYLSVSALHLNRMILSLEHFSQHQRMGYIAGFRLESKNHWVGTINSTLPLLIEKSAVHLTSYLEWLWYHMNQSMKINAKSIKRRLAMRLCADAVLIALQRIAQLKIKEPRLELSHVKLSNVVLSNLVLSNVELSNVEQDQADPSPAERDEISSYADCWLKFLSFKGESALQWVMNEKHKPCLCLERKACCMYFLISEGKLCSSCPKLSWDERVYRQRQETKVHA